jgi:hypothetical protein
MMSMSFNQKTKKIANHAKANKSFEPPEPASFSC